MDEGHATFCLVLSFYHSQPPYLVSNPTSKNSMNTTKPTIGQTITVYGQICTIVKVYPFGTLDVVSANGRHYRVTGLSF